MALSLANILRRKKSPLVIVMHTSKSLDRQPWITLRARNGDVTFRSTQIFSSNGNMRRAAINLRDQTGWELLDDGNDRDLTKILGSDS